MSKTHIHPNSKWQQPPSWLSKNLRHFSTIGPISPTFDRICKVNLERSRCVENAHFRKVKMAASVILNFEKILPFLYFYTNPHQILRIWYRTQLFRRKRTFTKILEVRLTVAIFFTFRPILTKLGGDVANSMLNATVELEMSAKIGLYRIKSGGHVASRI